MQHRHTEPHRGMGPAVQELQERILELQGELEALKQRNAELDELAMVGGAGTRQGQDLCTMGLKQHFSPTQREGDRADGMAVDLKTVDRENAALRAQLVRSAAHRSQACKGLGGLQGK